MAAATNSTVGTIALNGDFIASNANVPTLRPSGVRPGTYDVLSKIYIDAQGRTVWAQTLPEDFAWPEGSKTQKGIVQIGYTPDIPDVVTNDNRNIDVDGNSKISLNLASASDAGVVKLGSGFVKNGTTGKTDLVLPPATASTYGAIQAGQGFDVDSNGLLSVDLTEYFNFPSATETTFGLVQPSFGFSVSGAGALSVNMSTLTFPAATTTTLGFVRDLNRLTIAGDGTISVDMPPATETTFGFIKLGQGFGMVGAGQFLAPTLADGTTPGTIFVPSEFTIPSGHLSLSACTASTFGAVLGAGTDIAIDANGIISCTGSVGGIPDATVSVKGNVQLGSGFEPTSGLLEIMNASTSTKGILKTGTGMKSVSGVLSLDIPIATPSTFGSVKTGTGISVASGVISINQSTFGSDATVSTPGMVIIGTNLSVSSGTVSIPDATASTKGAVQVSSGNGLQVNSGVLAILDASTTEKGIVQIASGDGISINSGIITTAIATTSVKGAIRVGDGLTMTGDTISVDYSNYIKLDSPNTLSYLNSSDGNYSGFDYGTGSNQTYTVSSSSRSLIPYIVYVGSSSITSTPGTINFYVNSSGGNPRLPFDLMDFDISIILWQKKISDGLSLNTCKLDTLNFVRSDLSVIPMSILNYTQGTNFLTQGAFAITKINVSYNYQLGIVVGEIINYS